MELKRLTLKELSQYDGRNGNPAYIAYKGRVYDLTTRFLWKTGRHQAMHNAGEDLTTALERAPHGEDLLERVKMIGIIVE